MDIGRPDHQGSKYESQSPSSPEVRLKIKQKWLSKAIQKEFQHVQKTTHENDIKI